MSGNGSGQVPAQGGSGSVNVTAARECAWSASVEGQWLTIKAGSSGQGDGSVEFTAAANPDPAVRRGAIVVNEQKVDVVQAAAECTYRLSESAASFTQAGGSGAFDVRASSSLCTWTAQSSVSWIVVRTAGKGTAAVEFDVEPTTGAQRSGAITAAGQRYTITQTPVTTPTPPPPAPPSPPPPPPPPNCSYSLSAPSASVPATGGTGTLSVSTAGVCTWTAVSNAGWLTITSGASNNTGAGNVSFSAAPNSGSARSGTLTVAGQTFTVNQAGAPACSYKVSPQDIKVNEDGKYTKIDVETDNSCSWTAVSTVGWIRVVFNASGSGDGQVWISISENKEGERQGTVIVAGQTVTVKQQKGN